jgi:hypothetical protein
MKFLIKTSAVGISDKKFAQRGEYETEEKKEIERLRDIAKKFPDDVEEIKGKAEAPKQTAPKNDDGKKENDKAPENPKDPEDTAPKDDPKKAESKPANNSKK